MDYEGPHGAGLMLPTAQEVPIRAHVRRMLIGVALILVGIVSGGGMLLEDLGRSSSRSSGDIAAAAIFLLLGLLPTVVGAYFLRDGWAGLRTGRSDLPKVMLTVDGVVQSRHGKVIDVPWDALGRAEIGWTKELALTSVIDPTPGVHRHGLLRNWLSFELDAAAVERHLGHAGGPTELRIPVDELDGDPRLAVLLLEFYRDHPEERAELRTVEWQDRADNLVATLEPLVIVADPAAREMVPTATSDWEPPPIEECDPKRHAFGSGWYLRRKRAENPPRSYDGRWGTGFGVPLVPGGRDRRWLGFRFVVISLWLFFSGVLLLPVAVELSEDGFFSSDLPWLMILLVLTFPLAAIAMGWELRRVYFPGRRSIEDGPSLMVVDSQLYLLDAGGRVQQSAPWEALGEARLFWDKGGVGPYFQRREVFRKGSGFFAKDSTDGRAAIGPNRRPQYPWLLNWLAWELDPEAVLRHRRERLGTVEDELVLVVDRFLCDPRLVVRLIEYYRDHPEQRSELTTGAWQERAAELARTLVEVG